MVPPSRRCDARFDVAALGRHLAGGGGPCRLRGRARSIGNDISGFADPDYLRRVRGRRRVGRRHPHPAPPAGARSRAGVRRRRGRRCATSSPIGPRRAEAAGIPPTRIMVDAGLDLGKTRPQSLELLRASDRLAALGYPLLLSASNKRVPRHSCSALEVTDRRDGATGRRTPSASRSAAASSAPTTCEPLDGSVSVLTSILDAA